MNNTFELNTLSQNEIVQLNSFFKSKELTNHFKLLFNCRPKLNYYNLNSNARDFYTELLDSRDTIKANINNSNQVKDTLKFWTSSQILNMRDWDKKSKYYIVFYRPENHIISFEVFSADINSSEDSKNYTTNLGKTRSTIHFTILLTDDNYKVLASSVGVKD